VAPWRRFTQDLVIARAVSYRKAKAIYDNNLYHIELKAKSMTTGSRELREELSRLTYPPQDAGLEWLDVQIREIAGLNRLWCKRFEVEPSRRREVALNHAARTAFQILGAVLPLVPSLPSLN
jgi:hypothetical protein